VTPPVLELKNVSKTYPTTPPVHAVQNVDMIVAPGELLAVVGPSGSGKSTMLHIMGTLDRPTSGEVTVAGHDVSTRSDAELSGLRSAHIGFVFQAFHLLTGFSALDNVADGLLYTGMSLDDRRARAYEALVTVGLGNRLDHVATQLSGGEGQRVAIARAIVGDHSLVLADEPTGNLDTQTSEDIVELLHHLNGAGTTIVVVTHDLEIAESLPRIVRLRDGRIESDRTKEPA
jgi:putative ABC transport system ATP-binding protein